MARGRKPDAGTHEAREKILLISEKIKEIKELSQEAQQRIIKAVYFGLNVKQEETSEKKSEETKEKIVSIPKEKKIKKKVKQLQSEEKINQSLNDAMNETEKQIDNSGDEYFSPEECYPANE